MSTSASPSNRIPVALTSIARLCPGASSTLQEVVGSGPPQKKRSCPGKISLEVFAENIPAPSKIGGSGGSGALLVDAVQTSARGCGAAAALPAAAGGSTRVR